MQHFIEYPPLAALLKASWQSAVLIVLVLIVQRGFNQRLGPRWRYSLWLLVVVRLALPWTMPAPVSLFNMVNVPAARWGGARVLAGAQSSAVETPNAPAPPAKGGLV